MMDDERAPNPPGLEREGETLGTCADTVVIITLEYSSI
jgi:hypothetical protein